MSKPLTSDFDIPQKLERDRQGSAATMAPRAKNTNAQERLLIPVDPNITDALSNVPPAPSSSSVGVNYSITPDPASSWLLKMGQVAARELLGLDKTEGKSPFLAMHMSSFSIV